MIAQNEMETGIAEIDRALRALDDKRRAVLELAKLWPRVQQAKDEHPIIKGVRVYEGINVEIYIECVVDDKREIAALLRWFAERGHRQKNAWDSPDTQTRNYTLTGGIWINIGFNAGGACHYVKVGEKVVPEFKLRCDQPTEPTTV